MNTATSSVEFSFNNNMYKQTDGITMRSLLGPVLANKFVVYHEFLLFDSTTKPCMCTKGMLTIPSPFSKRRTTARYFTINQFAASINKIQLGKRDGR